NNPRALRCRVPQSIQRPDLHNGTRHHSRPQLRRRPPSLPIPATPAAGPEARWPPWEIDEMESQRQCAQLVAVAPDRDRRDPQAQAAIGLLRLETLLSRLDIADLQLPPCRRLPSEPALPDHRPAATR